MADRISIFGIAGPLASGKTSFAQLFVRLAGVGCLSFGELVFELARQSGPVSSRDQLHALSDELIRAVGFRGLTERLLQKLVPNQHYVIEGIRDMVVVDYLRERFTDGFRLIYIDVSSDVRYQRAKSRGKLDDTTSLQHFRTRDAASIESGVFQLKEAADIILSNNGQMRDAESEVRRILSEYQIKTL